MEIRHYLEVLRRRIWIVALLTVVAVGGVIFQVVSLEPQYEAEVSMLVTPRVTAPTSFEDSGPLAFPPYREAVIQDVMLLIQSREVMQRAADKVGAPRVESLRRRTEVSPVRGSDFLLIKGRDDSPERAALIANTLAQEFMNFYVEINRAEARQSQTFVEGELRSSQQRLRTAELALREFRAREGASGLTGESTRMAQRLVAAQSAYETATIEGKAAQSRVQALRGRLRMQEDPRLASVSIATNPIIAQLRTQLTTLELELAGLRQSNTEEHPKVKELLGRVADARQRLKTEGLRVVKDESLGVSPIREQLVREMVTAEVEGVVARARAAGIQQQIGGMRSALKGGIPQNELTLARLERDVKLAEEIYGRLSTLHQETVIRENRAASSGQAAIVLVDRATVPEWPVSNQLPVKAGAAGLAAIILGAALALLVDGMDDRIRSPRQAEGAYGLPVLAAIPVMNHQTQRTLATSTAVLLLSIILVIPFGLLAGAVLALGAGYSIEAIQATFLDAIQSMSINSLRAMPEHLVQSAQVLIQKFPTGP